MFRLFPVFVPVSKTTVNVLVVVSLFGQMYLQGRAWVRLLGHGVGLALLYLDIAILPSKVSVQLILPASLPPRTLLDSPSQSCLGSASVLSLDSFPALFLFVSPLDYRLIWFLKEVIFALGTKSSFNLHPCPNYSVLLISYLAFQRFDAYISNWVPFIFIQQHIVLQLAF